MKAKYYLKPGNPEHYATLLRIQESSVQCWFYNQRWERVIIGTLEEDLIKTTGDPIPAKQAEEMLFMDNL